MSVSESSARPFQTRPGLLRALGRPEAVAIVVGNVIGSGIFAKPGAIAAELGDFRLILLVWLVGGGLCVLGALCFAELAAMLPRAGGLYVYLREAYGPLPAFLMGWTDFLFSRPGSIGALATIFTVHLATIVSLDAYWIVAIPIALIIGLAVVNISGVIWGGFVQDWTTLIKAGFVLAIALLPLVFGGYDGSHLASRLETTGGTAASRFALALLAVMWAYNGWHGITPVAEEVRDPQRNLPFALFTGIGILIVLYVGANLAYHSVLSMAEVAAAGEEVGHGAVERLLGRTGGTVMALAIMCSTFGAMNSNLLIGPRVAFAMGRDRVFFSQLGRVHVTNQTPSVAIAVQAAMAIGLVLISNYVVHFVTSMQGRSIFDILTNFVIFGSSLFYLASAAAVIVLRIRHPEWPRPYKTWGYPVVPAFFVGFYMWFLWHVFWGQPFEAISGLGLILLGVPVFFLWSRKGSQVEAVLPLDDDESTTV